MCNIKLNLSSIDNFVALICIDRRRTSLIMSLVLIFIKFINFISEFEFLLIILISIKLSLSIIINVRHCVLCMLLHVYFYIYVNYLLKLNETLFSNDK